MSVAYHFGDYLISLSVFLAEVKDLIASLGIKAGWSYLPIPYLEKGCNLKKDLLTFGGFDMRLDVFFQY